MMNNNIYNDFNNKKRNYLRIIQRVFLSLAVIAATLAFVFLGSFLGRVTSKPSDEPIFRVTSTTSSSETTAPETTTQATTTIPAVSELLASDALSDELWGPLPEVTQYTPLTRNNVHGIYIGTAQNLDANIELANNSEINSFVIDLKESYGICFNTTNELANSLGYVDVQYDLQDVCQECHDNGIWVIGRIVCFKDSTLASARPDLAICDVTDTPLLFYNEGSEAFINPYNPENWDYLIDLAIEAIEMGVDEIQFDYVRFPTGGTTTGASPYYGIEGEVPSRSAAINRFFQTARREIQYTYGVPVSGDVFGIAVSSRPDGNILGQDWPTIGLTGVDSLCPMIYPSHYALGTILNGTTYPTPDTAPYDIVYYALMAGSTYHNQAGYSVVRPYLQAFDASYLGTGNYMTYDYNAINSEIRAVQDAGLDEFILWNQRAEYPTGNYGGNAG